METEKKPRKKYDTEYFSIRVVKRLLGLSGQTLRQYEKLGILLPVMKKGKNNERFYAIKDIKNFLIQNNNEKIMKQLLKFSNKINLLPEDLKSIINLCQANDNKNPQQNN